MLNDKCIFTILIWLIILVPIFNCMGCSKKENRSEKDDQIIGVKIYNHEGDLSELYAKWNDLGINTVFCSTSLLSNAEFRTLAREYSIETFIILPIFFNADTLQVNPDLYAITNQGKNAKEEWVEFVCPSREDYRKRKIETIKKFIRELDPDGLSLDFIRHFVFWEKVYPDREGHSIANTCFDSHCLAKFEKDTHISIPNSLANESEISEWIINNHLDEWTEWKCSLITAMIREITKEARQIKPEIKINVHAVPWRQQDFNNGIKQIVGQDFSRISAVADILSPMTYAHMVKREPAWIHSVVQDIAGQANCKIVPSIQVNKAYLSEPLSADEFGQSVLEALKPPSSGVIFWSWEQLNKNPEKLNILKSLLDI